MDMVSLLLVACVSSLLTLALWMSNRRVGRLQQRLNEQAVLLGDLRVELRNVNSGAVGVGQHLLGVENRLAQAIRQQKAAEKRINTVEHESHAEDQVYTPYNEAGELADQGAEVEELIRRCGLSEAEALLMNRVHARH